MPTLHEHLILYFCNSSMMLWGKCQPDNLWYSSETGGFLLEAGAVKSTFLVIYFIAVIQYSIWRRHFFKFFYFFYCSQWSTYAFTMATFTRQKNTFLHILVFYNWTLNALEVDCYNLHPLFNNYAGTQDRAFLLAHWFSSAFN